MSQDIVLLKTPRKQKPLYCPSCLEKVHRQLDKETLPYCSVVCRTLGRQGFGWRLNPYRIVDLTTEAVLTTGPEFDLTEKGLAELHRKAERLREEAAARHVQTVPAGIFQQAANE